MPNLPCKASQSINPHFGIALGNQSNLCHLTVECLILKDNHVDLVEKVPLDEGNHISSSLWSEAGCQVLGIAYFKVSRSGEFATGHLQLPL